MDHSLANKRIKITVNGKETEVYDTLTILQALIQENIHIPHLCYDMRLLRSNGNCGLCVVELGGDTTHVKSCQTPVKEGMSVVTDNERLATYRKIRLEQLLSDHNADCVAPCVTTCPANIDIQTYLKQVGNGNYEAALRVIKDRNPFPLVCGRVCPHPCESKCRRNLIDSPVAINHVKRFVADWDAARAAPWLPRKNESTGKRIAIVGAGPSGLSAAYYSAVNGHDVTVFEKQSHAGGMMRYGIPEYRLPKSTLDTEIGILKSLGVKIMTGKTLGIHIRLEDLKNDFDAVYLAIGSWRATPLSIEGENHDGVWLGIQFLEQVITGAAMALGETVVVIGGGNTAIDCARTVVRKGVKNVKLVYRRTKAEMPAERYEVAEALREGVEMVFLTAPVKITLDESGTKALHCITMKLGEPDRSGRKRPVPVEGSDHILKADTILGAIGQSTNTQFLYNDLPVRLNTWGDIEINGGTMQTSVAKVLAGGDCVTGPATVIQAVAAGRRAAEAIDFFLGHGYIREENTDYRCSRGSLEDLPRWEFEEMPKLQRAEMPEIGLSVRLRGLAEVAMGLREEEARAEAGRCLICGCGVRGTCDLRREAGAHGIEFKKPAHERPYIPIVEDHPFIIRDHNKCISCGLCVAACSEIEGPDILGLYIKHGRQLVGTKSGKRLQDTDCVSCGQCVNACPCGALAYRRERGKVFRAINDRDTRVVGFVAPAVRSVISERFNIPYDKASSYTAGLLRRIGFDKLFDFSFAADLTIVEETTEFLTRIHNKDVMPQFTSCCPGWVNFVEKRYPGLIPHLSTCKSPQQMMAATIKNQYASMMNIPKDELYVVSIVPCLAKKYEAARPEFAKDGIRDVDAVLTTEELIEMLKLARIDTSGVECAEFDEPYKQVSGAGVLFGASGGVAEAALRMAVEKMTGRVMTEMLDLEEVRGFQGLKESTVTAGSARIRVAVVSGLANAEPIIEKILDGENVGYDLIEVMACPGGCICGAGHPVPEKVYTLDKRQNVLIHIDKTSKYRKSQENPDILRLYKEYYGEPNSPLAHELLHTTYSDKRHTEGEPAAQRKAESAFITHEFMVCVCERCAAKGAWEVFGGIEKSVHDLKMDSFIEVKTIRMKDDHQGGRVLVTLDGKPVENEKLISVYGSIKERK